MKNLSYILFGLSNTTAFISKKGMGIFLSAYRLSLQGYGNYDYYYWVR